MGAKNFFSSQEQKKIITAIKNAENNSSGEIRVHIENSFEGEVLDRAAFIFKNLDMHKTKLRNGVLFYIALKPHKFAVIGDTGINSAVTNDFWEKIKDNLTEYFKENKFCEGLCKAIDMTGEELKKYFPLRNDDKNELPDDLSFD